MYSAWLRGSQTRWPDPTLISRKHRCRRLGFRVAALPARAHAKVVAALDTSTTSLEAALTNALSS